MSIDALTSAHERVYRRRVRVLSDCIARLLPPGASVLDIGCGDGELAAAVLRRRPDISVEGIDVLVRPETRIPVVEFDGVHVPATDRAYDAATLVDVLHHAEEPETLLAEAARSASLVVIKDHCADGILADPTLRFMDRVGNERHGVALRYDYWSERRWLETFERLGLRVRTWERRIPLYPPPLSWVFGRSLHVVAVVERAGR